MALEGDVKLPGIGPVKKKTAAYGAVGAAALVLVIYWYRQRQAANAAAAATPASSASSGSVTDPAGNTCSAVNPQTGYCPGTAEDTAALSDSAAAGGAYDTSSLGDSGLSGYYYGAGGATQATAPGPENFADNAEWAQYVEAYLTSTLGGDPSTVGNAIGKYLTGQPVTPDLVTIINEAIAYGGQPPQSGANGMPPGINTAAANTGTSTTGSTSTGSTSTGSAAGGSTSTSSSSTSSSSTAAAKTQPAGAISNLQSYDVTSTGFTVKWNPAQGATGGYKIVVSELSGPIVKTAVQTGTSLAVANLHPGWTYNVGVQGLPGGAGDNIHVPLPSK
jgi:hypothetical protein